MAEITESGYQLKTQNDWFGEERQLYLDIDPAWNLDPSTPDGLKMAHDAEIFSALDELGQQAYNSKDPNKATGQDLDVLCALTGTSRSAGTPSTINLTMSGVAYTVIAAGVRVESTETGTRWTLDNDVTLSASGTATAQFTCEDVGATEASIGTLTKIIDTVAGWSSVTNAGTPSLGTNAQADSELRVERNKAVGRPGVNQIDSMLGELFAVDGVRRVKLYENDTDSATISVDNPHGLPAHSIAPIVDGGTDADVAMAIYLKKNPGVTLYQAGIAASYTVTSPKYPTNTKLIKFSRPVAVPITIAVTLVDDGSLPSDIETLVKDAIINYATGELFDSNGGFDYDGFDIGDDVIYFRMLTPVNKVVDGYGQSYVSAMTLNGGTSTIAIAFNQLASFSSDNITVTVS